MLAVHPRCLQLYVLQVIVAMPRQCWVQLFGIYMIAHYFTHQIRAALLILTTSSH